MAGGRNYPLPPDSFPIVCPECHVCMPLSMHKDVHAHLHAHKHACTDPQSTHARTRPHAEDGDDVGPAEATEVSLRDVTVGLPERCCASLGLRGRSVHAIKQCVCGCPPPPVGPPLQGRSISGRFYSAPAPFPYLSTSMNA